MLTTTLSARAPSEGGRWPRIDAHQHLWRYRLEEFGWIDESMAKLRRDFLVKDLEDVLRPAGIDAAIAVQARQTLEETHWLLDCADGGDWICGVVGWAPVISEGLASVLDRFANRRKLLGIREMVQTERSGYLDQASFDRGIRELTRRGLAYDLVIREHQLVETTRLVDRHPEQRFVLDHAAKPLIAKGVLEPWRSAILDLGKRENVFCKVSGLVTEADWSGWSLDALRPYLDVCVDAFGPKRLMAGSDWPVCLVATRYARWWETLSEYLSAFEEPERERILGGTAIDFYRVGYAPAHATAVWPCSPE